MPLFAELSRLALRYHDACQSPLSCPRDREILLTKLQDLEAAAKELRTSAAAATDLSPPEQYRLAQNLEQLRKIRARAFNHTVITDGTTCSCTKPKTSIRDLEELTVYVRFLSEVLDHSNGQGREPEPA